MSVRAAVVILAVHGSQRGSLGFEETSFSRVHEVERLGGDHSHNEEPSVSEHGETGPRCLWASERNAAGLKERPSRMNERMVLLGDSHRGEGEGRSH